MDEECEHNQPFWECEICGNVRVKNKNRKKEKDISVWIAEGKEQEFKEQMLKNYPDEWFQCAVCGEIWKKKWSDRKARKEFNKNFPGCPEEDIVLLCSDCYQPNIEKAKKLHEESLIPESLSSIRLIFSFEELQKFEKEEYPEYNEFYTTLKESVSYGFCKSFDLLVILTKRDEMFPSSITIDVDGYQVDVSIEKVNLKLVAICHGDLKVIPVFEEIE